MSNPVLQAALDFYDAGFCVVPTATGGGKAPHGKWKEFQSERPSRSQVAQWFANDSVQGLGIICGAISGNAIMIEAEGRAVADGLHMQARELADASGLGELFSKVVNGYTEMTPSGGIHWIIRCEEEVEGNKKLASRPGENGGVEVLFETRGTGGFTVTAPSHGITHESGQPWVLAAGSIASIPTLTREELNAFQDVFRAFDSMPAKEQTIEELSPEQPQGDRPGDDFNQKAKWEEILIGWKKVFTDKAGVTYWRRPDKSVGISATTGKNANDRLYVFTTSTTFQAEQPYSKFAAYTHLNHNDNFKQATKALRGLGYGLHVVPEYGQIRPLEAYTDPQPSLEGESMQPRGIDLAEVAHAHRLAEEVASLRAKREARKVLDAEEAARNFVKPSYFAHIGLELELPDEEMEWVIEDVFPQGANISLTAQYKAGKTTLVNALAKSLVDGEPFLNYYKAPLHPGRVVIFNFEVSKGQYRRWLKDVGIVNVEKVSMVHLRGERFPIIAKEIEDIAVEMLQELNCQTWIVDPFAAAFAGCGDENSNSDVGNFLQTLDVIKKRAGVSNLVIPMHTGRAQEHGIERARGATRLDDWADVRWLLKKTDEGRFFSADGRDVLQDEQLLKYEEESRALTLGGSDARGAKRRSLEDRWVDAVEENPGFTTSQLCEVLGGDAKNRGLKVARDSALKYNRVKALDHGTSKTWYLKNAIPAFQADISEAN
ncbi:MAG: AAA family ATPase [Mariniphaga sp.]